MTASGPVFVTGGSGLVGSALVKRLLADGRVVRALGRSEGSRTALKGFGADPVAGDVESVDALSEGMNGCDAVFHAAGTNAFCVPDPSTLFRVNVVGSVNVVIAAARAGVARIVYTSSAATLGETKGTIGSESSEHRGWFLSDYERSKFEGEKAVLAKGAELGVEVVCVNPSSVQGPGRAGGTGKILVLYLEGRLKFFVPTRISLVDIDDCTEGHLLAERKGVPGERYVLSSQTATIQEALDMVARITGVRTKPLILPGFVASGATAAVEWLARVRGRHPAVCREMVRTLLHGHAYDGSRAARELGLEYRPMEETLRRSIEWLRGEGLISEG